MKICYINVSRDGGGYANSSIEYMRALYAAEIDVVSRPVKMTPTKIEIPQDIVDLEQKDLLKVDAVIQHNLPSEWVYKGGIQNIGLFHYETSGFPNSAWAHHIRLMDKIVVSSNLEKKNIIDTCGQDIASRIYVVPHPVGIDKFSHQYEKMDFGVPRNCVKFYTIAEFNRRKNIPALLAAYCSTFSSNDNVVLIIKTNQEKEIKGLCGELKQTLGRFKDTERYPKIALITGHLSEKHINSLHSTGDIFITASHGEAICLPLLDAIGFGNPAIVPYHSAFVDYAVDRELMIESLQSTCLGVPGSPEGLYTADETWGNISISDLGEKMREVYRDLEKWQSEELKGQRRKIIHESLNYKVIGDLFKKVLNA